MSDSKEVQVEQNQGGDQNQQQGQDNDKVLKQHEQYLEKLAAILGGKEKIFPSKKIGKDTLGIVVEGMLKERKEKLEKEVKESLVDIVEKKVTLDKEIRQKEDELKKIKVQKTKEFNDAISKVFAKIEDIDKIAGDYRNTMSGINKKDGPSAV